ncbi:MAG: hypothetical protein N5P05_004671 (plasmid) [Chroococcopsis gigantea SAG 12.99]|nr:hypothetical protein [Chroococcopsis gigantea SAG 12.99]
MKSKSFSPEHGINVNSVSVHKHKKSWTYAKSYPLKIALAQFSEAICKRLDLKLMRFQKLYNNFVVIDHSHN